MKKYLFFILLGTSLCTHATSDSEEAKKSLRALIGPILKKSMPNSKTLLKDFSVEKCEHHKINWMDILLLRKEIALTYTFKPGCDIQGTIYPKIIKPFPSDLKIKDLGPFNRLESENKITTTLEAKPVMNLAVRSAKLSGKKGSVKFEADYQVRIDPLKQKDPVEENLGGELRITEILGKSVSIKEKIKIE